MKEFHSLQDIRVKKFNKYFSATIDTVILAIDDIGEVTLEILPPNAYSVNIVEGEIVSVICEEYYNCQVCRSKMQQMNELILQCPNCRIKSKITVSKKTLVARVQIRMTTGEVRRITLFRNILQQLIDTDLDKESAEDKILMIDHPLRLEVDNNDIAKGVTSLDI